MAVVLAPLTEGEWEFIGEPFSRPVALFEVPFLFSSGDNLDLDFVEFIVDAVSAEQGALNVLAVHLSGFDRADTLLRKLASLNVKFEPAAIDHGEMTFPVFVAALRQRFDNMRVWKREPRCRRLKMKPSASLSSIAYPAAKRRGGRRCLQSTGSPDRRQKLVLYWAAKACGVFLEISSRRFHDTPSLFRNAGFGAQSSIAVSRFKK